MLAFRRLLLPALVATAAAVIGPWVLAQTQAPKPARVQPPRFEPREYEGVFFENLTDAFSGERPADLGRPKPPMQTPSSGGGEPEPSGGGVYAWSNVISRETTENEVKRLKLALDKIVTTPGRFKAGGFQDARREFSVLALMFAVIAEYDKDIRWKEQAPGARELFARVGFNTKVGTIQAYNESKQRLVDLTDLVAGGQLQSAPADAESASDWERVADRPPLMQRLEVSQQKKLTQWTSSASAFQENREDIIHESEVVAAIAEAIQREGYEFAEDPDYLEFCKQLESAARTAVTGAREKDYEKVRKAVGEMGQSCSQCHENYRA